MITRHNWRAFALCGQEVRAGRADPRWWDSRMDNPEDQPSESETERKARHAQAQAICRQCPQTVQKFCLETTKAGVDEGVRVGLLLTEIPAGQPGGRRKLSLSA